MNESLFELNKVVRIQFQHNTNYFSDNNLIEIKLRIYYSYDQSPNIVLVDFQVQNVFEVINLKQYFINKEFILPQSSIAILVSLSISHARALMAKNIAGTMYQENILPVVNPMDVAKAFYPNMFKETGEEKLKEYKKGTDKLNKTINSKQKKKKLEKKKKI